MVKPASESVDIAVAGAGVVGAAAALTAANAGFQVLLIEPHPPQPQPGALGVEIRNLALNPAARGLLESLGAWTDLRYGRFQSMRIWEERGTECLEFRAKDMGRTELGWIVEQGSLANALWSQLSQHANITLWADTEVQQVVVEPDQLLVQTSDGVIDARLLLAADGARSPIRESLGQTCTLHPTGHHVIATTARTSRSHDEVARQNFLVDGPLALLPSRMPELVSIVWSQNPANAKRRMHCDDAVFIRELEQASERVLGEILAVDKRLQFPVHHHLVADFNPSPRVLLLGDAARVVHPLAGLGANLGLEDVSAFAAALPPAGTDPGATGLWRIYARRRRARARMIQAVLRSLQYGYSQAGPRSQWLRNAGVAWLQSLPGLKQQVMREALGLGPMARLG